MANEQKDLQQKVNQNGRPVSVFTREHLETAANVASESSDILGYLKDGTSIVDNYNFRWGLIHSKNTPLFSKERLEKAKEFRFSIQKYSILKNLVPRLINWDQKQVTLQTE